jgi:hypothetical protein
MLQQCQSISPLIAALWIASNHTFEFEGESKAILDQAFRQTIEKILNYVLDEGWNSLLKVCSQLRHQAKNVMLDDFQVGIFRDVDCELLMLMILRCLLALKDQAKDLEALYKKEQSSKVSEVTSCSKICCSMDSESCSNHYLKV